MPHIKRTLLYLALIATSLSQGYAFQGPQWRIAPERINIVVGDERTLQVLDDAAQEQLGVEWSTNDPSLATVSTQGGRLTLRAVKPGTVRVTAILNGEQRSQLRKTRHSCSEPWPFGRLMNNMLLISPAPVCCHFDG